MLSKIKKRLIFICCVFVFLLGGWAASLLTIMVEHDRALERLQKQLQNLPLLPNTKIIDVVGDLGILRGHGNHCDFFAGLLLNSSTSLDALSEHYRNKFVAGIDAGYKVQVEVLIRSPNVSYEGDSDNSDLIERREFVESIVRRKLADERWQRTNAVVYVIDASHDPEGDWRCH